MGSENSISGEQFAQSAEAVREADVILGLSPQARDREIADLVERQKDLERLVGFLWTHKGHRGSNASILAQAQAQGLGELLQEVLPDWTTW
jgi:hypothetical protein